MSIAMSVTIAHRFLERTPRHVNGLITRMVSSSRGRAAGSGTSGSWSLTRRDQNGWLISEARTISLLLDRW